MTRFNPKNKPNLKFGESIGTLCKITDKKDAQNYFNDYVKYVGEKLPHLSNPKETAIRNIKIYLKQINSSVIQNRIESFDLW